MVKTGKARFFQLLRSVVLLDDLLQFVHECIHILEFTIYGRKSYIGYLIDLLKFFHDLLAYDIARNLLVSKPNISDSISSIILLMVSMGTGLL